MYEQDADIGHQQFDLKLTDRVNMRMVGVPEVSFDYWASKFIAKGLDLKFSYLFTIILVIKLVKLTKWKRL